MTAGLDAIGLVELVTPLRALAVAARCKMQRSTKHHVVGH